MPGDYGFTMSVNDLTSSKLKQIENSIKGVGSTVNSETKNMENNFNELGETLKGLQNRIIEAFSVYELYNFGKELVNLTARFQGYQNVIKYSSINAVDAAQNINYLGDAVNRLHLPMEQAFEAFSEMQAGFYGTGIEGDKLRKVFEGVAEAATVMHLSPEAFSRTTFALKEIGELGTVQMRQMRMLAFALPGSMNLAAKSMGMNSEEFHKAMKGGQIQSSVFLPKFAAALTGHFSGGLENASHSLISLMNQTKTEMTSLFLDMGDKLTPLFQDIFQTIGEGFKEMKSIWDSITENTTLVNALKTIFDVLAKVVPLWIAYKVVMLAANGASALFTYTSEALSGEMESVAVTTGEATVAMDAFELSISSLGIGALVAGIGLAVEQFISMNQQLEEAADKIGNLGKMKDQFHQTQGLFGDVKLAAGGYGQMQSEDKQALVNKAADLLKMMHTDSVTNLGPEHKQLYDSIAAINHRDSVYTKLFSMPNAPYHNTARADTLNKLTERLGTNEAITLQNNLNTKELLSILKKGAAQKIFPAVTPGDLNNTKDQAMNTSNLAGASGGLGQARIIHIDFHGPFQQNNGVHDLKKQATAAIEELTRMVNNFSDSENAQ